MEKPNIEISDAYRASRRNVSIFSGLALAWAAAQFEISTANLPLVGDVTLTRYSVPILLAAAIVYLMVRCTIEFMMQPLLVRRWRLAQLDYRMTLGLAVTSISWLAASGVSRSITTVALVTAMGLLLAVTFVASIFLLTMLIMPLNLFIRARRVQQPSVASAAIESTHYALALSGLGFLIVILWGGSWVLSWGYKIIGLTEPPAPLPVAIFLITCAIFTVACFLAHRFLLKVFAFQPPYIVKTEKLNDGTIGVNIIPNTESNNTPEDIQRSPDGVPNSSA